MMLEKLDNCPVCDKALSQGEYDMQSCGTHWVLGVVKNHRKHFPALPAEKPSYRCPRGISDCQCGAEYCRSRR